MTNLKHERLGNALILKPTRRIDSSSANAFEADAGALLDEGSTLVVIDASDIDYISSAGIRVILTTAKKAKAAGGGLTIACAKNAVKEVLEISGFNIFGLHETVEQAMASLGGT